MSRIEALSSSAALATVCALASALRGGGGGALGGGTGAVGRCVHGVGGAHHGGGAGAHIAERRARLGFDRVRHMAQRDAVGGGGGMPGRLRGGEAGSGFHALAKYPHGARHGAHLVAPGDAGDGDVQFAAGEALHGVHQMPQGHDDVALNQPGCEQGDGEDHPTDCPEPNEGGAIGGLHIVDPHAGKEHHLPGGEAGNIGNLRLLGAAARFEGLEPDRAAVCPAEHIARQFGGRSPAHVLG